MNQRAISERVFTFPASEERSVGDGGSKSGSKIASFCRISLTRRSHNPLETMAFRRRRDLAG